LAATLIVYFVSNLFDGVRVTFAGAVYASLIIDVTEYIQHLYLTKTGKTRKRS